MLPISIPSRHLLIALAAMLLLSLGATPSLAGQDFQLHLETRSAAKKPTTAPAAVQWSADLSVVIDQPFSAKFVEGNVTTSLQGTVHRPDKTNTYYRISLAVKRVVAEVHPGASIPILNTIENKTSIVTSMGREERYGGLDTPSGSANDFSSFITLSPAPANP